MEDFTNVYGYRASFDISHAEALIDFVTGYEVEELRPIDFRLSFWKGKVGSNSDRESAFKLWLKPVLSVKTVWFW